MKRTTISLSDQDAVVLELEAKRRGTSVSGVLRLLIREHLSGACEGSRPVPFAKLGRSKFASTGRDMEELFADEWKPDAHREPGR